MTTATVFLWVFFSVVIALVASRRNRPPLNWAVYALLLSPLLAGILLLVLPPRVLFVCPMCREPIAPDARKCRHCGELLDPAVNE